MTSRISVQENPRIIAVLILPAALLGACALVFFVINMIAGVVLAAILGLLAYRMVRYVIKQLASRVDLNDEGLSLNLYGEEVITLPWPSVAPAGVATDHRGRRTLYVYREDSDRLIMIPDEFSDFDGLVAEMERHRTVRRIALPLGTTLNEALRAELESTSGTAG